MPSSSTQSKAPITPVVPVLVAVVVPLEVMLDVAVDVCEVCLHSPRRPAPCNVTAVFRYSTVASHPTFSRM